MAATRMLSHWFDNGVGRAVLALIAEHQKMRIAIKMAIVASAEGSAGDAIQEMLWLLSVGIGYACAPTEERPED